MGSMEAQKNLQAFLERTAKLAAQMRHLAAAVEPDQRPPGGVRYQPIMPETLRGWADMIDPPQPRFKEGSE